MGNIMVEAIWTHEVELPDEVIEDPNIDLEEYIIDYEVNLGDALNVRYDIIKE